MVAHRSPRIALVSCVKSKRTVASPAGDLYTSRLFRGFRAYAEAHADRWYILSAKHGVLDPQQAIAPYEQKLSTQAQPEWAEGVNAQLIHLLPPSAEVILFANELYRKGIEPFLREHSFTVTVPLEGLGFGRQLAWFKVRNLGGHVG